jgi:hypothetical protein
VTFANASASIVGVTTVPSGGFADANSRSASSSWSMYGSASTTWW